MGRGEGGCEGGRWGWREGGDMCIKGKPDVVRIGGWVERSTIELKRWEWRA